MKGLFKHLLITTLMFVGFFTNAQQSTNTVGYKVTYNQSTDKYTVWVVPEYSLPNANNSGSTEKGATAQVSIAVPNDFVIANITDLKGSWEKAPLKLGPGQGSQDWSGYSLDANTNYYVIGKSAEETDYGLFNAGVDVALFTFQGNGCFGIVRIIAPDEPFISASDNKYSLNTANSFYSRSGQPAGGNQNPLEQFRVVSGGSANCLPDAPILAAINDSPTTPYGTPTTTTVLGNDTRNGSVVSPADVTVTIATQPTNGTVTLNANGTITYTPNAGFSGNDSYTYQICDKVVTTSCGTATVSVTVSAASPVIIATNDSPTTASGTPTTTTVLSNDTRNGSVVSPADVTVTIATQPTNGTVTLNANGTITYTPNAGFSGNDSYTYKVCDKVNTTVCSTATVSVTVTAPVRQIFAFDDNKIANLNTAVSENVLVNDFINNGIAPLSVITTPVALPMNGTVVLNANGNYTYTPSNGFVGTDTFKYQVCDNGSPKVCDIATVSIDVRGNNNSTNQAPIALGDKIVTKAGVSKSGNLLTNDTDPDGDPILATIVTNPSSGTLTLDANGNYTYTPNNGFTGTDSFVYKVCDNRNPQKCDDATVGIEVYGSDLSNLPPVADDDLYLLTTTVVSGNVLLNDVNPNGGGLIATPTPLTAPTKGTVVLNSNGTFTYTPSANFDGFDSFVYEVCTTDLQSTNCSQATVNIIQGQIENTTIDLSITKVADKDMPSLNDEVTFSITIKNNSTTETARNIIVEDELPAGFQYISGANTNLSDVYSWLVPQIAAGQTAVLTLRAKVIARGVTTNTASIISCSHPDDNLANNEASACVSVPITLCQGENLELTAATSVDWYKDGVFFKTGNSIFVTESGSYTNKSPNSTCPTNNCCPIVVITQVCCPENICIPITIKKIR